MSRPPNYCRIDGCQQRASGHGLCQRHYMRWRRNGDPLGLIRAENGSGYVTEDGYRMFHINGRDIFEHRLVLESVFGRKLLSSEHVHHIDHNKLNNSPENLMIVSNSDHKKYHATFRSSTHKECSRCHVVKPRNEFWKDRTKNHDKHYPQCCDCKKLIRNIGLAKKLPNRKCSTCKTPVFRWNYMKKFRYTFCSVKCQSTYISKHNWRWQKT